MGRFQPIRVNYVALYFRDWLPVFQTLSTIECGIYWRLCCFIYEAGGRLENKTSLLASLSGLSELEFGTYWSRIKHKFVQTGDYLYHQRCTKELKKTYQLTENARKGGLLTAKKWKNGEIKISHKEVLGKCSASAEAVLLNETNTKQNNNITNTSGNPIFQKTLDSMKHASGLASSNTDSFLKSSSPSCSSREGDKLVLYGALQDFFNIRSNADRTSLDNICKWAVNHNQAGKDFYRKVIDLADEAKRKAKTNRWGYFFDVLRRQLGYVPGKTVA